MDFSAGPFQFTIESNAGWFMCLLNALCLGLVNVKEPPNPIVNIDEKVEGFWGFVKLRFWDMGGCVVPYFIGTFGFLNAMYETGLPVIVDEHFGYGPQKTSVLYLFILTTVVSGMLTTRRLEKFGLNC